MKKYKFFPPLVIMLVSACANIPRQVASLPQPEVIVGDTLLQAPALTTPTSPVIDPVPATTTPSDLLPTEAEATLPDPTQSPVFRPTSETLHPLAIEFLRQLEFPGSDILVEEELEPGANYRRYLTSYLSEGLKIYALLTIPDGDMPATGWPAIVFNHGFIPPGEYRTTERYVAYVDSLARAGYVVFRPDYRGHGFSEGEARGAYGSPGYVIDVLNALESLRRHPRVDREQVGMWGHSMGGYITLRAMVTDPGIKAGVIWAGVVADYEDLMTGWRRRGYTTPESLPPYARLWRQIILDTFGDPQENPEAWDAISANAFLQDLSGPVQLHHASGDTVVPLEFSQTLAGQLQEAGKEYSYFVYDGDDHNISQNFSTAMTRTIEFFDKYLKQ